jgi:hypothetical protein
MGLFGKRREERVARKARVLQAAGTRIRLEQRDHVRALSTIRQPWQTDAWNYRDQIGELRFAVQFLARAVARVQYLTAQVMPDEDEPIPLNAEQGVDVPAALRKAAAEELQRLPLDAGYTFLGVLAENLEITGEAWLHGKESDGEEVWQALSVDEVHAGQDGVMYLKLYGQSIQVPVTEEEELLRVWVPHPRYKQLADSPMQSLLGPCEDLVCVGRELRAASRSRFAANGVLLVPDGLTMLNQLKEDSTLVEDNEFMADLAAVLLAPIANELDPGSVVPAVITGNGDDLDKVRHLRMDREDSEQLLDKQEKALARIGRGLDVPPEIISGMGDVNHWTSWQIDKSTFRHHIEPLVRLVADSLTEAFLRPALLARGFPVDQVKRIQVWYDAGAITENPNRGQDAKDAFDRGAIGYAALSQALGFNPADAPDDEEVLRMLAFKIGVDTTTAAALMARMFGAEEMLPVAAPEPRRIVAERQDGEAPVGPGDAQPGTADQATPNTGGRDLVASLLAAVGPPPTELTLDTESGRKLMDIDRDLRTRLLHAADDALTRALEKAGARMRSKAQRNAAHREALAGVSVEMVGKTLGRDAVLALGTDEHELLSGALDALEGRFNRWTLAAIDRTVDVVLSMLGVSADSERGARIAARIRNALTARIGSGWGMFRDALLRLAERYLFDPTPETADGELVPDVIVPPGLIRGVLSHVGGPPPDAGGIDEDGAPARAGARPLGGIGLGSEVSGALHDEGAEEMGFEWIYGLTPVRHFEPHRERDGKRFSSWSDPGLATDARYAWVGTHFSIGDHTGCMCDYAPAYAIGPRSAEARVSSFEQIRAQVRRWMERAA